MEGGQVKMFGVLAWVWVLVFEAQTELYDIKQFTIYNSHTIAPLICYCRESKECIDCVENREG